MINHQTQEIQGFTLKKEHQSFSFLKPEIQTPSWLELEQDLNLHHTPSKINIISEENNKAFSIYGTTIIETSVSFNLLSKDVDVSAKEVNRRLSLISNVDSSCAVDGLRLGLHKVVRVSPKTNSSSTAVVCGAFRSIFAAIALDTGDLDTAGNVLLTVHGRDLGFSMDM
ncbi:unnamed protein product [Vicia faba]|uniref:RNase III domain-containing protein n=1 Tax=Vicia faba TaxID=3906 RepID=A0AAV1AZS0_VICFA|nr:unnamed protein product [Vicia faba]